MTTDFDFAPVREQLDAQGFALTPPLLTSDECAELAGRFDDGRIRSTVDMARHRFGAGRYKYFDHPLPELIGGAARRAVPGAGRGSPTTGPRGSVSRRRSRRTSESFLEPLPRRGPAPPRPR